MEGIQHRIVKVNGINMHIAEKGQGPVILFLHGFPELWYSWRHQITALASLGYRAVAPDLRGFGDTDAPPDVTSYTCFHVIGDLVGLIDTVAPSDEKVFVVGHDWGAFMAWFLCLFRPDRVKALVNLSVVFNPFGSNTSESNNNPIEALRAYYGDDYYMCRFQVTRMAISQTIRLSIIYIYIWVSIWVRIHLFDSIRCELNGFGFEKIDSFNKLVINESGRFI